MLQHVNGTLSIEKSLRSLTKTLRILVNDIDGNVLVDVKNSPTLHSRIQFFFNYKFNNDLERRLYEIIVTHATQAEKMGPGAFDRCIRMTLEYLEQYIKGFHGSINEKIDMKSIMVGRHPKRGDLQKIIEDYTSSGDMSRDLITEAIKLAGFGGRIMIEKTNANIHSIELSRGYTFDVVPSFSVTAKLEQPRIFCIDGYIESVSEIHHLLENASEIKEPGLLFVRGLSNDVLHTLKVNYDRGSLKLIPIIVKYDLEGINTLNDIAIVSGCDVTSSTKGDLISSLKFNEATKVESVVVYPSKVIITNSITHVAVATQISFLTKKRNDESVVSDVGTLFDKRIKSLSPNQVTIRIPDTKDYVITAQSIDYTLRAIKSAVDYGVNDKGLVSSEVASVIHSKRCVETLVSIGAVVTL